MPRARRTIVCLLIALLAVAGFSGCAWKGEGKQVAAAILATSQVKTRAFSGSMKLDMSGVGSAGSSQTPKSMTMNFTGAIDSRDAANPKMVMNMTAEGQSSAVVAPGNGKVYVTEGGRAYYTDIPPSQTRSSTIDPQKIYAALGSAVGDFQKAPAMTNAQGKQVTTISATVNRSKLCGAVLDAFGQALSQAGSGLAGGLGSTGSAGGSDSKVLQSMCKSMLQSDPRVWFGLDGGRLTDVDLTADLTIPFGGKMHIEVQYHEYNQDQQQTGFDAPAGAAPLSSLTALPGAQTS